ncbi:hypothetical protein BD779DRAFT_1472483 [Infundibulicybe gibba]|nr:hypothetical protein BD779DRAFT_1472483 [Infundibulicybe gibba]
MGMLMLMGIAVGDEMIVLIVAGINIGINVEGRRGWGRSRGNDSDVEHQELQSISFAILYETCLLRVFALQWFLPHLFYINNLRVRIIAKHNAAYLSSVKRRAPTVAIMPTLAPVVLQWISDTAWLYRGGSRNHKLVTCVDSRVSGSPLLRKTVITLSGQIQSWRKRRGFPCHASKDSSHTHSTNTRLVD